MGVFIFIRDDIWHPKDADKWIIINLIPHFSLAWWLFGAAVIILAWVFESACAVYLLLQAEIANRSPQAALQLIFDPSDERCVSVSRGQHSETYRLLVHNRGPKSLVNVTIRALPSWFSTTVIATASMGQSVHRSTTVVVRRIESLDPGATDVIELFGLQYHAPDRESRDILNFTQEFTIEGRAQDTDTVSIVLRYDPETRPMVAPA